MRVGNVFRIEAAILKYKEHGIAAFERVFETGHVYRAEPHASSRHLTEYYSLDLEMGFIGLERLTSQILGLKNVREAVPYPRDRYHLSP